MKNIASQYKRALGLALLLCPGQALASDYSGLPIVLYGLFGIIFAVVFTGAWVLSKEIPQRWLRVLVRCATAAFFWAPIDLDDGQPSAFWPVCCFFLNPSEATEAPFSIVVTTLLLWGFFVCLPRPAGDAPGA